MQCCIHTRDRHLIDECAVMKYHWDMKIYHVDNCIHRVTLLQIYYHCLEALLFVC